MFLLESSLPLSSFVSDDDDGASKSPVSFWRRCWSRRPLVGLSGASSEATSLRGEKHLVDGVSRTASPSWSSSERGISATRKRRWTEWEWEKGQKLRFGDLKKACFCFIDIKFVGDNDRFNFEGHSEEPIFGFWRENLSFCSSPSIPFPY